MLKPYWVMMGRLRNAGITLAEGSGSTMPEESCRSGGGRSASVT
jgi:hypothetical protein